MKPRRAFYKKNSESLMKCYCFQLEYASEIKRLMINLNTQKAYFIDERLDLFSKNQIRNYFIEEWVQELILAFIKNQACQNFEYSFESKFSKFDHSKHLVFNLFSNKRFDEMSQGIIAKPV